ncbi:MAG: helix-turn-helix transcriptional regulator [Rhodoferax sp.]|nr:helix-turn-helix transcriptional regulator [Rhodoferax sp.]
MLNILAIESAMLKLGLNGTSLAEACQVSKEATSNWLSGESIPRPSKLTKLAEVLGLPVDGMLTIFETPAPLFAYRANPNAAWSASGREAAEEQARHLSQLLPYVGRSVFEPPVMREPSLDDACIRHAAHAVRAALELSRTDVLTTAKLEHLLHTFGAVLVPVLQLNPDDALTVYLPESKTAWVIINLSAPSADYLFGLARAYSHCLTLHCMPADEGALFAERFAQYLLFPDAVAPECQAPIRNYGTDKLAPSMAFELLGTDTPSLEDYVAKAEQAYRTHVFKAIQAFQVAEGGRNPAFIASVLNVSLGDAVGLSHMLWAREH